MGRTGKDGMEGRGSRRKKMVLDGRGSRKHLCARMCAVERERVDEMRRILVKGCYGSRGCDAWWWW